MNVINNQSNAATFGTYVILYPTKLNPVTFSKGRWLAQAIIMFYRGQELNSCPQIRPWLAVRIKQWLGGNKIY